jgi:hypothetical protein
MLTKRECVKIFKDHLPKDAQIKVVKSRDFVAQALAHRFIQTQIHVGIYSEENIHTDFLSCAVTYTSMNRMDFCYEQFLLQAEGVDDATARAYLTHVALHEAHHFHTRCAPVSVSDHAHAELKCIEDVARAFPEVTSAAKAFEVASFLPGCRHSHRRHK